MQLKSKYVLSAAATILTVGALSGMRSVPIEASLSTQDRIGGSTTNAVPVVYDGVEWTLFNVANELRATRIVALGMVFWKENILDAFQRCRRMDRMKKPARRRRASSLILGRVC